MSDDPPRRMEIMAEAIALILIKDEELLAETLHVLARDHPYALNGPVFKGAIMSLWCPYLDDMVRMLRTRQVAASLSQAMHDIEHNEQKRFEIAETIAIRIERGRG